MKSAPSPASLEIKLTLPAWVDGFLERMPSCATDEEKMALSISLARENVLQGTGGPFGAVVFREEEPVAVGINGVERLNNSVAHAEVLALMGAESRCGSYTLRVANGPGLALFTSCEPCAMCLGAVLWSGISRLVCGACREDAQALGFEEGPVFPESYQYLEARGVEIVRGLLAGEAGDVLKLYQDRNQGIYNG